jgi:hypothetical protein
MGGAGAIADRHMATFADTGWNPRIAVEAVERGRFRPLIRCRGENGEPIVSVVPTKAQLVLKVTTTNIYGGNVGAKIPAGSIITVDPSFTGSYQTNGTQTLTLDLDVQHEKSASELQTDVDGLGKQVDLLTKARQKYAASNPSLARELDSAARKKSDELDVAYRKLGAALTGNANVPYGPSDGSALADHNLAATLWSLRQELLNVNHRQRPCVKPNQLKSQVDFEVVKDAKASLGIDIYIVSVGVSAENKSDSVQTLIVTFDMTGGSSVLIK